LQAAEVVGCCSGVVAIGSESELWVSGDAEWLRVTQTIESERTVSYSEDW
jgi:hypothetical protein